MDKQVLDYVTEKTNELINAPSCCQEAKDAAKAWLDAVGTTQEAEETKKYIAEIEADITTIDGLIVFTESDKGKEIFGTERAEEMAIHARKVRTDGGKYCFCPACSAIEAILSKKAEMLK